MSLLKSAIQGVKSKIEDIFLGDPVKEWGEVFERQGRWFNETISIDLYRKHGKPVLWIKLASRSSLSRNTYAYAMDIDDLRGFVTAAESRYRQLCRLARAGRTVRPGSPDRLPLMQQWILKLILGIRASKLLADLPGPGTRNPEYRIFGFVTRKSETRVLIVSEISASKQQGVVISGEGFAAVLQVLAEYLDSDEAAFFPSQ